MLGDPETYQFDLDTDNRPPDIGIPEKWYPGIKQYWDRSTSRRIYNPITGVRAVVIHATAGSSSEGAVSVMRAGRASFHWLVPDEDEPQHGEIVWACAPEALAAWHVRNDKSHPDVWHGEKKINHWSLGIELVNRQSTADAFSEWQIDVAARVVRYCWAKYPNLAHVVSHARLDPGRRSDPGAKFPWAQFRERVLGGEPGSVSKLVAIATPADRIDTDVNAEGCCTG